MIQGPPRITYVYDDDTQKLLQQYTQQMDDYERIFDEKHKHLSHYEYSYLRELDPILMTLLEVIGRIHDTAIPIRVLIVDESMPPTGATH